MGFFTRLSDIVAANINDLLDRMEEPKKMMKQLIREMEDGVNEGRAQLVAAIAHERRLEKEIAAQKQKAKEWQARAVEAVQRERDDLARRALELKRDSEAILAALELELPAARESSAAMKTQLRALQAKLDEARRKKAALVARKKSADLKKKAAGISRGGKVKTSAFDEFERMEDNIAQAEAEADALIEVGGRGRAAEDEIAEIESHDAVDRELAAIKKKVGKKSGGGK